MAALVRRWGGFVKERGSADWMTGQSCGICASVSEPAETFDPALFKSMHLLGMTPPATMADLVCGWLAQHPAPPRSRDEDMWAFEAIYDLIIGRPDLVLRFVDAVMDAGPSPLQEGALAAGPLEDLLGSHGEAMIDDIELKARREPRFRRLLTGVWQNAMSDAIWERVQVAANLKRKAPDARPRIHERHVPGRHRHGHRRD
jgi:hypothetical protein